jgi:hypothetical protein
MTELMQASRQWASRPSDERFVSLYDMHDHFTQVRDRSKEVVVSSRKIQAKPLQDEKGLWNGLAIEGPSGHGYAPTNWAFGQLSALAEAPARYLRTLPSPLAADCINYGLKYKRDVEDVGILLYKNGEATVRAATGPRYGRIWNEDILAALTERFGDGATGQWKVPGEFGKAVKVTKDNTTLFAGDRDMFVFLADEEHRIKIPDRRNGKAGSLARGFFIWNSEVGAATFGLGTFLFDYVCCNRIVWGATQYREIRLRHTASAPDKFLDELKPALISYANSSTKTITDAVAEAKAHRLDDVDEFLAKRFTVRVAAAMKHVHELEEGRPVETRWDAVTAATAYAKSIEWQDDRVLVERKAGELLTT